MTVTPTRPQLDVRDLHARLDAARLPALGTGWDHGVPADWLRELLADWRTYDVGALQARLDAMEHVRVEAGGQAVHAVVQRGTGPDPLPLVCTHGWPGTFLEHAALLPLLAEDFTLVLPSYPGFGFSDPPPTGGLTARAVAELWHGVMTELDLPRYAAHGTDLGVGVTTWLGRLHPEAVVATHIGSPHWPTPPEAGTPALQALSAAGDAWTGAEGGYAHEHSTKPATLAVALLDSPAGLAAWIGEKYRSWSEGGLPREALLATLTVYWSTGTIGTSLLPYAAHRRNPGSGLPIDRFERTPAAVTIFGGEEVPFPQVPRELAARYENLVDWATYEVGGHFPAIARPELLAERLRAVFGPYR